MNFIGLTSLEIQRHPDAPADLKTMASMQPDDAILTRVWLDKDGMIASLRWESSQKNQRITKGINSLARPKLYPLFYCSHCPEQPLKRHKDIYHDCPECKRHYKVIEGEAVEIPKRAYTVRSKVAIGGEKGLSADEYESLVG